VAYEFEVAADELFGERYAQMVSTGVPVEDIAAVGATITDMWAGTPGGWVYEWSQLADRYARQGDHELAATAFGWAKFPTISNEPKRLALAKQVEQYQLAAPTFDAAFERTVLELPYDGGSTEVPVHLLTPPGIDEDHPVVVYSGGVDTWKMDMHGLLEIIAKITHAPVLAFDLPGTGESTVPMSPDVGADLTREVLEHARELGNGIVVHFGLSMGGHYSAHTGLAGEADAAVVLGGPIDAAFTASPSHFGMLGIVANALGYDAEPTEAEITQQLERFSLRPLLDADTNVPMLVMNGADDVHVPPHDVLVFQGRRDTEVHLLPDTGHCAITKLDDVVALFAQWFEKTLPTLPRKTVTDDRDLR